MAKIRKKNKSRHIFLTNYVIFIVYALKQTIMGCFLHKKRKIKLDRTFLKRWRTFLKSPWWIPPFSLTNRATGLGACKHLLCVTKICPPFGRLNDNVGIKFENSLQIFQRIITSLFPMAFADSLVIFKASQDSSFSYRWTLQKLIFSEKIQPIPLSHSILHATETFEGCFSSYFFFFLSFP